MMYCENVWSSLSLYVFAFLSPFPYEKINEVQRKQPHCQIPKQSICSLSSHLVFWIDLRLDNEI